MNGSSSGAFRGATLFVVLGLCCASCERIASPTPEEGAAASLVSSDLGDVVRDVPATRVALPPTRATSIPTTLRSGALLRGRAGSHSWASRAQPAHGCRRHRGIGLRFRKRPPERPWTCFVTRAWRFWRSTGRRRWPTFGCRQEALARCVEIRRWTSWSRRRTGLASTRVPFPSHPCECRPGRVGLRRANPCRGTSQWCERRRRGPTPGALRPR